MLISIINGLLNKMRNRILKDKILKFGLFTQFTTPGTSKPIFLSDLANGYNVLFSLLAYKNKHPTLQWGKCLKNMHIWQRYYLNLYLRKLISCSIRGPPVALFYTPNLKNRIVSRTEK